MTVMAKNPSQPTPPTDDMIVARDLYKSYGRGLAKVDVLRGLNLSVRRGEFLAVMGPSGCGKTTLLHLLGLMTLPDIEGGTAKGQILLDGVEVPPSASVRNHLRRTKIGFVFQRFNLISVLSAVDNVAISLRVRKLADEARVDELFQMLGVAHLKLRKPGQMSIGEQQRLAVVRALAHRPAVLLADEPTGNLDSGNSAALLNILRETNRKHGQTIVMITHSAEAASYADRTVRMKDGRIIDQP
jgi:putative ABC transport system ATP-binding protein